VVASIVTFLITDIMQMAVSVKVNYNTITASFQHD